MQSFAPCLSAPYAGSSCAACDAVHSSAPVPVASSRCPSGFLGIADVCRLGCTACTAHTLRWTCPGSTSTSSWRTMPGWQRLGRRTGRARCSQVRGHGMALHGMAWLGLAAACYSCAAARMVWMARRSRGQQRLGSCNLGNEGALSACLRMSTRIPTWLPFSCLIGERLVWARAEDAHASRAGLCRADPAHPPEAEMRYPT